MAATKVTTSKWCTVLSTEGHRSCEWAACDCACHITDGPSGVGPRRPHSFPRGDWARGKRPPGWREAEKARKKAERLAGFPQNDPVFDDLELSADD